MSNSYRKFGGRFISPTFSSLKAVFWSKWGRHQAPLLPVFEILLKNSCLCPHLAGEKKNQNQTPVGREKTSVQQGWLDGEWEEGRKVMFDIKVLCDFISSLWKRHFCIQLGKFTLLILAMAHLEKKAMEEALLIWRCVFLCQYIAFTPFEVDHTISRL